jgi:FAD binding domain
MTEHFSYDRRELLRRGFGGALGLGIAAGWPLAQARAAVDPRLAALARVLDGDVVPRGGKGYAQARLIWNPRFDGIRPLAVAYVETIADIRRVIQWANRYDVQVATRSGGHSFAGYSTTPGLVLDVSRLTNVHPNADGTAAVAAGAKLGSVYGRLWNVRRAILFGTCAEVGVSGLTLGGGHGYSSRAFGLACDNVTQINIVTADGKHRVCNGHSEPELFWALRGAGVAGSYGAWPPSSGATTRTTSSGSRRASRPNSGDLMRIAAAGVRLPRAVIPVGEITDASNSLTTTTIRDCAMADRPHDRAALDRVQHTVVPNSRRAKAGKAAQKPLAHLFGVGCDQRQGLEHGIPRRRG